MCSTASRDTILFSSTSMSISLRAKVRKAFSGVVTIGSPLRLKDVFIVSATLFFLGMR